MSKQDELMELLEGLVRSVKKEKEKDCDCCENPIMDSMQRDYEDFTYWAFEEEPGAQKCRKKAMKKWQELHPHLPVPRVLQISGGLSAELSTACFFMDAYHLYLAEKKK